MAWTAFIFNCVGVLIFFVYPDVRDHDARTESVAPKMQEPKSCSAETDSKSHQEPTEWRGYSMAFHLLLPVAGFFILWGRRDLFNKLLLHVDRSGISVFCPSFSQRQKLLRWAAENLPSKRSSSSKTLSGGIPDLWKDGSILCTLLNMAVPGACQNPPKHWKKPPSHAQALAFKYLGIEPVFNESDFADPFTAKQERKFLMYLQNFQQSIKSRVGKEIPYKFTQNYLAKGMGLHNGEQHKKSTFFVYSNSTTSNCTNVLVYIRGPFGTQGTATIPAFYNRNCSSLLSSLHRQYRSTDGIVFKKEPRKSFLMSIASDISSLVNRKPVSNDIPIQVEMEKNRAKVTYIPLNFGVYEIDLITNGELLINSPYTVSVSEYKSGIKETLDEDDVIHQPPTMRKKKIVARYIDCIDERIPVDNEDSDVLSTTDESGFDSMIDSTISDVTESANANEEAISNCEKNFEEMGEFLTQAVKNVGKTVKFAEDNHVPSLNVTEYAEAKPESDKDQCQHEATNDIVDSQIPKTTSEREEVAVPIPQQQSMDNAEPKNPISSDDATSAEQDKLDAGPKRPTSIVSPFLINEKLSKNHPEERYEPKFVDVDSGISYLGSLEEKEEHCVNPIKLRKNIKSTYVDKLKKILIEKLSVSENTKTIKNIVNTSMKVNHQDENNNLKKTTLRDTSPICFDHIVPEVDKASCPEFSSVAERRKLFSRQKCVSKNSSFSVKENEGVSRSFDENYSLRLLSVIDTIRNSANSSLSRTISSSTPNISTSKDDSIGSTSEAKRTTKSSFVEARNYWLNLSTENCSINFAQKHRDLKKSAPQRNLTKISHEKYKSAEDITSISRLNFSRKLTKCCSLNQKDFESIDFISLEDRKKMLLQDHYETEKLGTRFIKRKLFLASKSVDATEEINMVGKKEQTSKRDEGSVKNILQDKDHNNKEHEHNLKKDKTEPLEVKSSTQFKRAFTFFKNLEKSNFFKKKHASRVKPKIERRFSLDSHEKRKEEPALGGSLRLPRTTEKFFVSRIYSDIMENKRGSFKGTPNKEALLDSLASLNTRNDEVLDNSNDPIKYNAFVNKGKSRRRKSLKSIFNVLY